MMKNIFIGIWTLLFIFYANKQIWGQEKKNSLIISGIAAHFSGIEDDELGPTWGYYTFPVDPGVELSFFRHLSKSLELGTGYNYQEGRVSSYTSGVRRFNFNEISIPLVLKKDFIISPKSSCFLTSGIYWGKTNFEKVENPDSAGNWHEISTDYVDHYSDDTSFMDIYLDAGYSILFTNRSAVSLAPFAKYRANTTWLNYYQNRFHFGIKINYSLKF